jgi:hypothetical protein
LAPSLNVVELSICQWATLSFEAMITIIMFVNDEDMFFKKNPTSISNISKKMMTSRNDVGGVWGC